MFILNSSNICSYSTILLAHPNTFPAIFSLYIVDNNELFAITKSLDNINERFLPFNVLPKLFIVPILLFDVPFTADIGRFICADDFVKFSYFYLTWLAVILIFDADWVVSFNFYSAFKHSWRKFFYWKAMYRWFYNKFFEFFANKLFGCAFSETLSTCWSIQAGFFNSKLQFWVFKYDSLKEDWAPVSPSNLISFFTFDSFGVLATSSNNVFLKQFDLLVDLNCLEF